VNAGGLTEEVSSRFSFAGRGERVIRIKIKRGESLNSIEIDLPNLVRQVPLHEEGNRFVPEILRSNSYDDLSEKDNSTLNSLSVSHDPNCWIKTNCDAGSSSFVTSFTRAELNQMLGIYSAEQTKSGTMHA
jgi:hypothetical protein